MHKGKIQIKDNVLKYISRKIEIFYKMKTDKVPPPLLLFSFRDGIGGISKVKRSNYKDDYRW